MLITCSCDVFNDLRSTSRQHRRIINLWYCSLRYKPQTNIISIIQIWYYKLRPSRPIAIRNMLLHGIKAFVFFDGHLSELTNSLLSSIAGYHDGFDASLHRNKDLGINICCFFVKHIMLRTKSKYRSTKSQNMCSGDCELKSCELAL